MAGFQEQIASNMQGYLDLTGQTGKWTADVGDIVTIKDVSNERIFGNPDGSVVTGLAKDYGLDSSTRLTATEYNNGFLYLVDEDGKGICWIDRYQLNKFGGNNSSKNDYSSDIIEVNPRNNYDDEDDYEESNKKKRKKKLKVVYGEGIAPFANGGRTPSGIDNGALAILHSNEAVLNANDTQTLDDIKELMKEIKTMYKTNDIRPSNYNNLYSNGLINTYDLNRIQNMGNNYNNDSHNQTIVNMTNNITNNNLQEVGMNEKSFEKMLDRTLKRSGHKFK